MRCFVLFSIPIAAAVLLFSCRQGVQVVDHHAGEVEGDSEFENDISYDDGDGPDGDMPECGNGVLESGELCDRSGKECHELDPRYTGGYAPCEDDCSGYDLSSCYIACNPPDMIGQKPPEWQSWLTMRMSGTINAEGASDIVPAFLVKINTELQGIPYNLDYIGYYIRTEDMVSDAEGNHYPAILGVGYGNIQWPVSGKVASLLAMKIFVMVDDLMGWGDQALLAGDTGVSLDLEMQVNVLEVWIEVVGTEAQYVRMECFRGISAWNSDKSAFEGRMHVCTDSNDSWAVGEEMKISLYAKMVDDEDGMLSMINEMFSPNDPGYWTDVCRCYTRDADEHGNPTTPMDCDEMKAEFGLGPKPDDDSVVSEHDPLPDDDVVPPDDDVVANVCGNGILEVGEECETNMQLACTLIDPVHYAGGAAPCFADCSGWDESFCIE